MTATAFPDDDDFRLSPEQMDGLRRALEPVHESIRGATDTWSKTLTVPVIPLPPDTATRLAEVVQQVNRSLAPHFESITEVTAQLNRQLAPTLGVATGVLGQFQVKTHIPVARLDLPAIAAVGQAIAQQPDLARELERAGTANEDLTAAAELVLADAPTDGDAAISREDLRLGIFAAVSIAWFAVALMVAMGAPDPSLVNWLWNLATRTLEGIAVAEWSARKVVPREDAEPKPPDK